MAKQPSQTKVKKKEKLKRSAYRTNHGRTTDILRCVGSLFYSRSTQAHNVT